MKTPLRLVVLDRAAIDLIEADLPRFCAERGLDAGGNDEAIVTYAAASRGITANGGGTDTPWWGGYLAVEQETARIVGFCGFKSAPIDGTVEIAYVTLPGLEGRGIGSGMAALLVSTASESPDVTQVIAHTLPEHNASTTILQRNGFVHVADVVDPDDGPVWRWERPVFA